MQLLIGRKSLTLSSPGQARVECHMPQCLYRQNGYFRAEKVQNHNCRYSEEEQAVPLKFAKNKELKLTESTFAFQEG